MFIEVKVSKTPNASNASNASKTETGVAPPKKKRRVDASLSDSTSCKSVGLPQYMKNKWQAVGAYLVGVLSVKHRKPLACILTSLSKEECSQIVYWSNAKMDKEKKNPFIKMVEISSEMEIEIVETMVKYGSIETLFPDIEVHPHQGLGHASFLTCWVVCLLCFCLLVFVCLFWLWLCILLGCFCFVLFFLTAFEETGNQKIMESSFKMERQSKKTKMIQTRKK